MISYFRINFIVKAKQIKANTLTLAIKKFYYKSVEAVYSKPLTIDPTALS